MYHVYAKVDGKYQVLAEHRRKADAIAAADAHPHRATVTKAYSGVVVHNNNVVECFDDEAANSRIAQTLSGYYLQAEYYERGGVT